MCALTLESNTCALTLESNTCALTLESNTGALTLESNTCALTLENNISFVYNVTKLYYLRSVKTYHNIIYITQFSGSRRPSKLAQATSGRSQVTWDLIKIFESLKNH